MIEFLGWVPSTAWLEREVAAEHSVLIEWPGHTGREPRDAETAEARARGTQVNT